MRVKAACYNWRLPTPYLKPALSEDTDMSREQLRAEGATMRVSGTALQMTLDLTGLPQQLRKRAGRISAAPLAIPIVLYVVERYCTRTIAHTHDSESHECSERSTRYDIVSVSRWRVGHCVERK